MTILVGVRCEDGIVIGSDSSATFGGQVGVRTIEQQAQKVFVVADKIIIAGSGEVGLGQRFTEAVRVAWEERKFRDLASAEAFGKILCAVGLNDFQQTAMRPGTFAAMVAFPNKKDLFLCELAITNFQPELKVKGTWFCSMGSGQQIADPFLGFLKRVFFQNKITQPDFDGVLPTLKQGMFMVTWTLRHAIELNPGGINGPPQIAVLQMQNDGAVAKYVDPAELEEHQGFVAAAEEYLGKFWDTQSAADAEELPQREEAAE